MRARSFFSFVFGCALGAGVVWLGLSRSLVVLPGSNPFGQVMLVNRWTGEGRYVNLRVEKNGEPATPRKRTPDLPEMELDAERLKHLQTNGWVTGASLGVRLHNHLDDVVLKSAVVQVRIPAVDNQPAVDREYTLRLSQLRGSSDIPPHADGRGEIEVWIPGTAESFKAAEVTVEKVFYSALPAK